MAVKQVHWRSTTYLECFCTPGSEVVLCLADDVFVEATLVSACRSSFACQYDYVFAYDDEQVDEAIDSSDIEGAFCKNCLTAWIEFLIAQAVPPT